MRRSVFYSCVFVLVVLHSLVIPHSTGDDVPSPITLLGVVYSSEVPYDMTVSVDVTLAHNRTMIPSATIYYAYLANGTTSVGGWRIARPQSFISDPGVRVTIYKFSLPYSAYNETFQYGARIVFYLEASDLEGNSLLTTRCQDRWDPLVQDDKFTIDITDPYPPVIGEPICSPSVPKPDMPVIIAAKVSDEGSGVQTVLLIFSAEDSPATTLVMNRTDTETYEAEIPPFHGGTKVTFLVRAFDRAGNRASGPITSYQVPVSLEAALESDRLVLFAVVATIAVLAVLGILTVRKKRRGAGGLAPREMEHPKAMAGLLVFILIFGGWLYYQLLARGAPLLGFVQAATLILGWGLIDPRVDILIPVRKRFELMPPTSIVVEGYLLGLATALSLGGGYLLHIYSTKTTYSLALFVAPYVLFLLLCGIALQLAWPYLRGVEISIEIEPTGRESKPRPEEMA